MTTEKQGLPVIMDNNGNPIAVIFFNQSRDRIIYMLNKASEDDIMSLLTMDRAGNSKKTEPTPEYA